VEYLGLAHAVPIAVLSLATGLFCGYWNLRMLASAGTRLSDSGTSKSFVISRLLRVGVFAIVAVAFAAVGPWWAGPLYIAGLLMPLAAYVIRVTRER
jgi:hypothetical protein